MRLNRLVPIVLLSLSGALASCADKPKTGPTADEKAAKPAATQAAITIEGVPITHGEIESLVEYFRETDPRMGRNKCIRTLLDQFLIPLAFVRRDKAEQLRIQRTRADALVETLGKAGYDELVEKAIRMPGYQILEDMIRQHVTIPEQQWLFDDLKTGQMSPVLASPFGYSVVAAKAKRAGLTTAADRADVVVVPFHVFSAIEFDLWYADLKQHLSQLPATAVSYHEDLRDALPPWLPSS